MNPLYWEDAVRRLQRNVPPNQQNCINSSMEDASTPSNDWHPYCEYSRYTANEPHNSMEVNVDCQEVSPSLHNFCNVQPEVGDPDGEPLDMNEEDPELTRKRNELREIEEQILQKKVALALKTVEPLLMETTPGFSCNEQSTSHKGETLRDRVMVILQQRHSLRFFKVQSRKERTDFTRLHKDGLLHKDHPLKLRVKSLMKQRYSDPLPSTVEENSIDKGFQRFLSVLNKGVDMDLLNRIVNDDSEDLPLGEDILGKNKSDLPFRSENQQSNSGTFMPGTSQCSIGEKKAEQPSQERSHIETHSMPDDWEKNDRGYGSFGSSSRSKSPPTSKKKKLSKKEEEKPKVDEQQEQLQNILKTLGLDLELDEMSKLADRTQERLYGKKDGGKHGADSREEPRSRLKASHRHCSNSSSSSFSSSSSRSTSRSFSPSPSRRLRSHSRDSKQRRTPEHRHSTGGSREQSEGLDSQHAPCSSYPDYTLSQCTPYHSDNYSVSTDSYWTYTQGAVAHPLNTCHQFPGSVAPPHTAYPHYKNLEDMSFFLNPDLSTSEGQSGSGLRCLQVINTKESYPKKCIKQLTRGRMRRGKQEARLKRWQLYRERRKEEKIKKTQQKVLACQSAPPNVKLTPQVEKVKVKQSEDVKRELTEEEIKANLRKKLEAFNQKVKQQVARPVPQPDEPFTG